MSGTHQPERWDGRERIPAFAALALSILCRSLVFVCAKYAALATSDGTVLSILINPWYWGELVALVAQAAFWVRVLKTLDLSVAYPVMALVYALNLAWSWYLFAETVTLVHITGCGIIIGGIILATRRHSTTAA